MKKKAFGWEVVGKLILVLIIIVVLMVIIGLLTGKAGMLWDKVRSVFTFGVG